MRYEYVCDLCRESLELNRDIDDRDEPIFCLNCGGVMRRLFSSGCWIIPGGARGVII